MVNGTQINLATYSFRIKIGTYDIQFEDHIDTGRVTLDHRQEVHVTMCYIHFFTNFKSKLFNFKNIKH